MKSPFTYKFGVSINEAGATYLESRISVRKFDLAIAAAPIGMAVVTMEQIQKNFGISI